MAEEKNDKELDDPVAAPAGRGGGLIVAFVSMLVVAESAMFFLFIPSAGQVSALAEAQLIESVREQKQQIVEQTEDGEKVEEFNLGEFGETFSPIGTDQNFRVEMRIFGLVRKKNLEQIEAEFAAKSGRIRHALRMKLRNCELLELQDNQLGLLERRLLTECNHLFSEDLLLGIGFNAYQLIAQ